MQKDYYVRDSCRICKSKELVSFLDLGKHPPSDAFLKKSQLSLPEPLFPLEVYLCINCKLVQLKYVVSPDVLFKNDYPYLTSISVRMQKHFNQLTKDIINRFDIDAGELTVDIGGNDGTLLKGFKKYGIDTLCIDPASVALYAQKEGIRVVNEYFTSIVAKKVRGQLGQAKVITGTNVFAHVDNLYDFLNGVNILLKDDGVLVLEFPYLVNLIEETQFDTIYHEHLSYFSLKPLVQLFKMSQMEIFDVVRVSVHGGSVRLFIKKSPAKYKDTGNKNKLLNLERKKRIYSLDTYYKFAENTKELKKQLLKIIKSLKSKSKRIAGDTAPAKGNTLLNYCNIGTDMLDYIAEISPLKQGLYTPGTHIPIYPLERIYEDKPDYLLILAWNIKDDVIRQQKKFKDLGGSFIVPIPKPYII